VLVLRSGMVAADDGSFFFEMGIDSRPVAGLTI